MDPKSKNDFDILFSSLEAWRKKAIAYCYSTKSGEPIHITVCPRWKSVSSHCMIYAIFFFAVASSGMSSGSGALQICRAAA